MPDLQAGLDVALAAAPDVRWSVSLRDAAGVLAVHDEGAQLSTASVGKLVLLAEAARRAEAEPAWLRVRLDRDSAPTVGDSGVWQHLQVDSLSVGDLATLVAYGSDNLATNVLLAHVGLGAVTQYGRTLGLHVTALLDFVRDLRDETMPPMLSHGCAAELAELMAHTAGGRVPGADRLAAWLALNTDLSMVAGAFGLDPLAHADGGSMRLFNKTGTDDGVRADVGHVSGRIGSISYAVLANFGPREVDVVLGVMRDIGLLVRARVDS